MSNTTRSTYTHETVLDAITDVGAAQLTSAAINLQWLVEHDDESRSVSYWLGQCIKAGADAKRRSVEYTVSSREARKAQADAQSNMAAFTNALAMNPSIMSEAKQGDSSLLLKVAGSFQIPTNVVLALLDQLAKQASAA